MRHAFALAVLVISATVALVIAVPSALVACDLMADRELVTAQQETAAVAFVVARSADPAAIVRALYAVGLTSDDGEGTAGSGWRIIVILPDGRRVGGDPAVRAAPGVPGPILTRARAQTGAIVEDAGARIVLQPATSASGGTAVIQSWTPSGRLPAGVMALWSLLALIAALPALASVIAAQRLGARGARLVGRFGRAAAAVRTGEVVVRIEPGGPKEMREAATAFNAMSEKVAERLAAERRLAGDLPHRLRTPLTALRLRVDRLEGGTRADAARIALERLEQEVDLLIQVSRTPGISARIDMSCDAAEVVAERVAYWSVLAEDEGRGGGCRVPTARSGSRSAATGWPLPWMRYWATCSTTHPRAPRSRPRSNPAPTAR